MTLAKYQTGKTWTACMEDEGRKLGGVNSENIACMTHMWFCHPKVKSRKVQQKARERLFRFLVYHNNFKQPIESLASESGVN